MPERFRGSTVVIALVAATVGAVMTLAVTSTTEEAQAQTQTQRAERTPDGRPNFDGVWQANNEAHWDLEAHGPRAGMVMQEGVYPYEYARVPRGSGLGAWRGGGSSRVAGRRRR